MELLRGKAVSDSIKAGITEIINSGQCPVPRLVIVRVGENPGDMSYERSASKKLSGMGIEVVSCAMPADVAPEEFKAAFSKVNGDPEVDGILVMRPLPKHLREAEQWLTVNIDPDKDVDCIGPVNLAGIMRGDPESFAPCTARSVIEILKGYGEDISGKNVTIVGRSMVVGKPLAMLLLKENATVTVCHTKTRDLQGMCRAADIIVAAAGHAKLLDSSCVRDGQVLVDVGTNVDEEGNLVGDIDLSEIEAAGISVRATPVPGGVGVVTTAVLADHVCRARMKKS